MSEEIAPTQVEVPTQEMGEPSRDDLIAAAKQAMSDAPDAAPQDEPSARIVEVDEQPAPPRKNRLFELLKEREESFKQRKQYNDTKRQLESEQQYIQKTKAELEAERAKFSKLKQHPIEAFREIGWTAADVQQAVLEDGTQEGREKAKYRGEIDEVKNKTQQLEALIKQQQDWLEQQKQAEQQRQETAQRQAVVNTFLQITNKESCPNLHFMYPDDDNRVKYGDFVANQYYQRTGKHISTQRDLQELSEYMESQAAESIDRLLVELHETGSLQDRIKRAVGAHVSLGTAPKTKANGSHTLRTVDASQRKTEPISLDGMTAEEERAYLVSVAKEAMRNAK